MEREAIVLKEKGRERHEFRALGFQPEVFEHRLDERLHVVVPMLRHVDVQHVVVRGAELGPVDVVPEVPNLLKHGLELAVGAAGDGTLEVE